MATKKKKGDHVIMRNSKMFCSHCGSSQSVPYPIAIPVFTAMTSAFTKMHVNCKPVWKEPDPPEDMSETERGIFWLKHGERGKSSETMFEVISRISGIVGEKEGYTHPTDPGDFSRCYKLLKYVPQWKTKLHLMSAVSPEWSSLG